MLVTHDMLEKSTPVCIAFNHMPWHYLAVARPVSYTHLTLPTKLEV